MRIFLYGLFFGFLLMLSSGVPVTAAPDDPVNIPDAVLRSRLETRLGKAAGATITEAEMATITQFSIVNQYDVRDLTGLEYLVNLTSLTLHRSTSFALNLDPLSGLTELEYLDIQRVIISDLAPLANLTKLKSLSLGYADISTISDLSKLTALVHLTLTRNSITDVSGLRGLTNLRQLKLGGNLYLSDISPLTNLRNLEILRLDRTSITRESLSAVLSSFSTEIDQEPIEQYPPVSITSGEVGFSITGISDLSVLDSLPDNVFLWGLYLRTIGTISQKTVLFHLKDLTPLVDLMKKGKVINSKTSIYLGHNYGLDYTSFYEEIPALIAGSKKVEYVRNSNPQLERESPKSASYEGQPGTSTTFTVRAVNTNPDFPARYLRYTPHNTGQNRQFAEVPVTWQVTAPDGTVTEQKVPTGNDGLSSFTITLGNIDETHTIKAIVPAKTNSQANLSHEELKVEFTATAVAPPVIVLTLHGEGVTQTSLQWIAEVSGSLPEAYVYYYKRSADRDWIEFGNLPRGARMFSFVHSELQPGTSYDCQLFGLEGGRRIEPGSNVLIARTRLGTATSRIVRPPADPPEEPPVETPEEPPEEPQNRPPAFRSASTVNVAENTMSIIRIVAEDPDSDDEIMNYAITGGADRAMLEIGGARSPSDMLRFKAAPDFENPQDDDTDNVCIITLTATSGVGNRELAATQTLTITVTDVNEPIVPPVKPSVRSTVKPPQKPPVETPMEPPANRPPVFTSASTVNVAENTTAVITVVAEDPDSDDEITSYTITGGADQAMLEIGGTSTPSDMLRFKTAPDFEIPGSAANSNVYTLILTATSGSGDRERTATQTLTVTVTDVDEPIVPPVKPSVKSPVKRSVKLPVKPPQKPPVETPEKPPVETPVEPPANRPPVFRSASAVRVAENTIAIIRIVAEDPDTDDEITNYAMTGGADRAMLEIGGTRSPSDMLRFKAAPDFENPQDDDTDNVCIITLTATSGVGNRELAATQTLTITVTDVDEPIEPPVKPPEKPSVKSSEKPPEKPPVKSTVKPPEKPPVKPPVKPSVKSTVKPPEKPPVKPPQKPPVNRPPVFRSASAVRVAENTIAIIRIVAEDPDTDDKITNYAMTGGADRAMLEIGGTRSPVDMLRFKAAPDFENPQDDDTDNVCIISLTATSGVGNRKLTATQTLTITVTDVDEPVAPPVEPPVEPPVAPSVGSGGGGTPPPIPIGRQSFIFNEIGNFPDDRNDWIELKNLCNTPIDLSQWQIRLIRNDAVELGGQIEIDVVSFPDYLLPPHAVLLVTNTEPSETVLAGGSNIATGARQKGAQHPYFVAPDLKLLSTPFLLVLQRTAPGNGHTTPTLMDVAGNYFWEVSPDSSEVYSYPTTPDFAAETAPLTDVGVYQRQRLEQPGYISAAWRPSGYHAGIGYDRHVERSVSRGTPGYRSDPSPSLPVGYRLVFNEIRNASNDTNDWIELKNVCGERVRLKNWHISIVVNAGQPMDEEVAIVSLPDYTLQMGDVLLITNTDPSETVLADGMNIATGARQHGAQHPYIVAPDLKLPERPYLLILQEVPAYEARRVEDVAGNYALTALPDGTEIDPHAYVSHRGEPLAPLTRFGAWQRRHFVAQPGYLATAWEASGYHAGIGYDRDTPAAMCLGTPGYRYDPPLVLPVAQRLAFNKIHNAANDTHDWIDYIELKNISDTAVRLKQWAISSVASAGEARDEDVDIVLFPDWTLPAGDELLILNADPEGLIANGRNIATGAQQTEAQRYYFVAPDLRLPKTPYLLILRHAREKNGTPDAIEDVAGDYFCTNNDTQVWPLAHTLRPSSPAAPLSAAGTWQRTDARHSGYLTTAWRAIESPLVHAYPPDAFDTLPMTQRLIFNKIRNAEKDTGDWIELKNISETAVSLRNWHISIVASAGEFADEDIGIVWFPDWTLPVNGVLLITNTEPDETVMVDGLNITPGANPRRGAQHPYLVAPDLKLPETPYLLILRHVRGKNGTPDAIEDVAGDYFRSVQNTADWLLAQTPHPSAPAAPLSETGTWQRKDVRQCGSLATAWTVTASPPGVGSAPNAFQEGQNVQFTSNANAAVIFNPTLPDAVRITELMYETEGPSETLPQWIELYNASQTPVDLKDWQLAIETRTDATHRHAHLTLKSISLPPKQTVILVTGWSKNSHTLPTEKIYDLSKAHREMLGPKHLKNTVIGRDGFFLQLIHPTGRVVDTCGTLDGDPETDDLPTWTLPDSKTPQGHRFSLLRRFAGDVRKGTQATGWTPAITVAIGIDAYYGHPSDISTPGSLHQIVPGASPTDALSISEILFETKIRTRALPQWIELYNPSFTRSVKLKDYKLIIETRQVSGRHHQLVIDLEAMDVLPNQTALIITAQGKHSGHFPANRTYTLSQQHPKDFSVLPNRSRLLSSEGFLIQLTDATGNVVDTVGNLDGYPSTKDAPAWTLPDGETPDGARAAIRRLYEKRVPLDGRHRESWVSTAAVPPVVMTYYGHVSDVGNPGFRMGGPLPVVLSSFRAVRDTDTVVVSWTTESSLENAGFHLYRSEQRTGDFIRINPRLIQGSGTTAERRTYTYVDKPPKADGVYYYQIEEVSYSGQQQVLATARIKGYLSANGKHLTTLGAVKTRN